MKISINFLNFEPFYNIFTLKFVIFISKIKLSPYKTGNLWTDSRNPD